MSVRFKRFAGMVLAGTLGFVAPAARATPYTFASNQITAFTVSYVDGSAVSPSSAPASVRDFASYTGFPGLGSTVNGTLGSALSVPQSFSGPGAAPAATYTPQGAGTFTGARSLAALGAGSLSGAGISISNAAEGYGGANLGSSIGTENGSLQFTVIGTGKALQVSFADLVQLITSSSSSSLESASATIQTSFNLTALNANEPLATFAPSELNRQISSVDGISVTGSVGPTTYEESYVTPVLASGVTYTFELTSAASQSTTVTATTAPLPKAAWAALISLPLAFAFRRKPASC